MDKSWMLEDRLSREYRNGVDLFMQFAKKNTKNLDEMSCPCAQCGNLRTQNFDCVKAHLLSKGVDRTYVTWVWHGESWIDESPGKSVALTLELRTNIIAYATIIKVYDPQALIHGKKFPKNCMLVAIEKAVDGSAPLPFPTYDCYTIDDAIGSHIAWPMHLMKLHVQSAKKDVKKRKIPMPSLKPLAVPPSLYMVYCYIKLKLEASGLIKIQLDNDVFGHECVLPNNIEDIDPFCRLAPITYLYLKLENNQRFRFVNPQGIAYLRPAKTDKAFESAQITKRARALGERLIGTQSNQLVLVPCNVGDHWVLTVIDPHKSEICLLDPYFTGNQNTRWKMVVETSLHFFNKSMKKRGKIKWNVIQAPKQPDSVQCGFFVLRYMREIVKFEGRVETCSLQSMFMQKSYSKAEIDEVREEWASCVQSYILE